MKVLLSIILAAYLACPPVAGAIVAGQSDTFEDGTEQGWFVGAPHPEPPVNVADGGPDGTGDNYLKITSFGGGGPGSRLAVINTSQWAGDYGTAGVVVIGMNLLNLGMTDLNIRLYLANSMSGAEAVSDAVFLPSGGAWTHVEFAVDALSLTVLSGNAGDLLSNVTELRILHSPNATFPPPAIVAILGIDGIRARASSPALPVLATSATMLLVLVLGGIAILRLSPAKRSNRLAASLS